MASDLPDALPGSSLKMARMLVQTMSCDHAVFSRLKEDFDHPPALRTIRQIRIEAACSRLPLDADPAKPHEGYYPNDAFDRLTLRNEVFVNALRAAYPERFAA